MDYANNIHLSKLEITILCDVFNDYVKKLKESDDILNYSHIQALNRIFVKINGQKYKMYGRGQLPWDKLIKSFMNDLCLTYQNKILELNLDHNVKTDFEDYADFYRWEKIRTYETI